LKHQNRNLPQLRITGGKLLPPKSADQIRQTGEFMLFVYLPITFIVAFNCGLLAGCLLSSRRIEKVAPSSNNEWRVKSPATEKTYRSQGNESQEFPIQQARSVPIA
jgi:hypothetical protein